MVSLHGFCSSDRAAKQSGVVCIWRLDTHNCSALNNDARSKAPDFLRMKTGSMLTTHFALLAIDAPLL